MGKKTIMGLRASQNSSFYPNISSDNLMNYAYSKTLEDEDAPSWASSLVNAVKDELIVSKGMLRAQSFISSKTFGMLDNLWKYERKIELDFLKNLDPKIEENALKEKSTFKKLIVDFNNLLNNADVFESSIQEVKALEFEEENSLYQGEDIEFHNFFAETLPNELKRIITDFVKNTNWQDLRAVDETSQKLADILKEGLFRAIENEFVLTDKTQNNNKDAYSKILSVINTFDANGKNKFIEDILSAYGLTSSQLKKNLNDRYKKRAQSKKKNKQSFKAMYNQMGNSLFTARSKRTKGGNAAEALIQQIVSNVTQEIKDKNVEVMATGGLGNQKADHLMVIVDSAIKINTDKIEKEMKKTINEVREAGETSIRIQNMTALEAIERELAKIKGCSLIEISDKNYNLRGSSFAKNSQYGRGFSAETPSLRVLQKVLDRASADCLEELVFVLVNSGNDVLNGNETAQAEEYIALHIGSFLFDDVSLTKNLDKYHSSLTKIHIFNLDGVFIPLSVFLEAAAEAARNARIRDYVDVRFRPGKTEEPNTVEPKELDKTDWETYYNDKLDGNTVAIHFFGDFVEFIKTYI